MTSRRRPARRHAVWTAARPPPLARRPDRREQLVEQFVEMSLRRGEQRVAERADVIAPKPELRELELQHPHVLGHARHDRYRRDFERVAIEQAEHDAIVDLEVLDERGAN